MALKQLGLHVRRLRHWMLGIVSCLLVVGTSIPVVAHSLSQSAPQSLHHAQPRVQIVIPSVDATPQAALMANVQAAESVLMAQGMTGRSQRFVAMMSKDNVVPMMPQTEAFGTVGAALSGNRLIVRGSFRNLSSMMRDYMVDPVDPPNPNITSAFHIHRGMTTENGPFQYALDVMTDATGMSGSAMGDYMLTDEQLTALNSGMLYVDLHTTMNRAGELRAVLMPMN